MMNPLRSRRTPASNPLWLIIFSDMSTNLMMFFLMLFAMTRMSAPDRQMLVEGMKEAMQSEPAMIESKVDARRQEELAITTLSDMIAYGRLKHHATLEITDDKVKLTLMMPLFFESGSAEIHTDAVASLESLVDPIQRFPTEAIVEGHTDNVPMLGGAYSSNWELSVARAVSVIEFLVSRGVPPGKLVAGGYGEFHPAHPNNTPQNMALNRRIEITIPRSEGMLP